MYNEKVTENMDECKNIFAASVDQLLVTVALKEINLYLMEGGRFGSEENWQCSDDDAKILH